MAVERIRGFIKTIAGRSQQHTEGRKEGQQESDAAQFLGAYAAFQQEFLMLETNLAIAEVLQDVALQRALSEQYFLAIHNLFVLAGRAFPEKPSIQGIELESGEILSRNGLLREVIKYLSLSDIEELRKRIRQ